MDRSVRFWDRAAASYDREEAQDEPVIVAAIDKARAYLAGGDVVLDVGCGTGRIAHAIAGDVVRVHALDTSPRMIALAQAKAAGRGITNVDYAQASLFDARYREGSFDAVLAFYVLHLVEDAEQALARIHALLKPGGWLISVTPCMGEQKLASALLSLVSRTGLIPRVRPFKLADLRGAITRENFEIVEVAGLDVPARQCFIAARKRERV